MFFVSASSRLVQDDRPCNEGEPCFKKLSCFQRGGQRYVSACLIWHLYLRRLKVTNPQQVLANISHRALPTVLKKYFHSDLRTPEL